MLCLFLVLFITCNDHCSNYTPIKKKCSDIVLNIHISSSSLLRCCGLFITMLWIDLSLQIAMLLLPSEHTLPCFQFIPSIENALYIFKLIISFSAPAKKEHNFTQSVYINKGTDGPQALLTSSAARSLPVLCEAKGQKSEPSTAKLKCTRASGALLKHSGWN